MEKARLCLWIAMLGLAGCSAGQSPGVSDAKDEAAFIARRKAMIQTQLKISGRDIKDPRVLEAMETVPRHEFVPESERLAAYGDHPLPIGYGQTISQPFIVAYMTEKLEMEASHRVLEIGTGSGYQAAILAELAKEVYTIEIVEPLARRAKETLRRLGYDNVKVKAGDGYQGWPEHAPFDRIIVTCAPDHIPEPLVNQLKEGGRIIIPVGTYPSQELYLLEKINGEIQRKAILPVLFVPMTGSLGED